MEQETTVAAPDLSLLAITLLKGAIYRENNEPLWGALLSLQARVRDYVTVLNLELVLDEAEGYAFLRSRPDPETAEGTPKLPRLIARRPLSFPVSLVLALLRKKLAEFDAGGQEGEGARLVLTHNEIVDLIRVFLPETSNEARVIDQIDSHINRVIDLGFLRRLKTSADPASFEVRRILKAFVDAQWLAEFDKRLASYRTQLAGDATQNSEAREDAV